MSSGNNCFWDLGLLFKPPAEQLNPVSCSGLNWNLHTLMLKLPGWCCLTLNVQVFVFESRTLSSSWIPPGPHLPLFNNAPDTFYVFLREILEFGHKESLLLYSSSDGSYLSCSAVKHVCICVCVNVCVDVQEGTSARNGTTGSRSISWHFSLSPV